MLDENAIEKVLDENAIEKVLDEHAIEKVLDENAIEKVLIFVKILWNAGCKTKVRSSDLAFIPCLYHK